MDLVKDVKDFKFGTAYRSRQEEVVSDAFLIREKLETRVLDFFS